jgi:hypothetical protein
MELKKEEEYIEDKIFESNEINYIRETIEKMNKFNQIEILRLLVEDNSVIINENKNGIHINLTQVNNKTLNKLFDFIVYVNKQESYLNDIEQQKETYKNTYFKKDNKDNLTIS